MSSKEVMVFRRLEKNRLAQLAIRLKNTPGALADVAERLAKARCNILDGAFSEVKRESQLWSCFVELRDPKLSVDQLHDLVAASDFVVEAKTAEGRRDLLIESLTFPLRWSTGDRAIMLRTEFFSEMETTVKSIFSTGADVFLFNLGLAHGRPTWEDLFKSFKVNDKEDLDFALKIYQAVGWCRMSVLSYDSKGPRATVRLDENFECIARRPTASSHFVRGHLCGAFEALHHVKVSCEETSCTARGDDFCLFQISPA